MDHPKYTKRSDLISLGVVLLHFTLTFIPVFVSLFTGTFGTIVCYLAFGFLANGLLNLMHELSHYHVFTKRSWNHFLGQYILAPLFLSDFTSYRDRHWEHHLKLGTEQDPKTTYRLDVRGWKMLPYFLQCLTLYNAAVLLTKSNKFEKKSKTLISLKSIFLLLLPHAFLLFTLITICLLTKVAVIPNVIKSYAFVFLYGVASITVFAATLRAVAEHQPIKQDEIRSKDAALRTMKCNFITRQVLGSFGFEFHASHHITPSIPYYHLSDYTNYLSETSPQLAFKIGYFEILLSPKHTKITHSLTVSANNF